jgi:deoxyribonuclease-4
VAPVQIGAHQSVQGGLHKALERGVGDGCQTVQVFTKNSNQWREPPLTDEAVLAFRQARAALGSAPIMAHTSYLINLATDKPDILRRGVDALAAEVKRSSALGVDLAILHPGAHLGAGDAIGLRRVADSLDEVHARTEGSSARITLENTAGQGTCVGHRFEHIRDIFGMVKHPERLAVCLDTQHMFAAGYDMTTPEGYDRTWEEIARTIGLDRVAAFHLNDSKKPLGSRVDRHEHVGEGNLGAWLFWRLVNDPRFAAIPGVLETEPQDDEHPYRAEVALLRSFVGAPEPAVRSPAPAEFALAVQEPKAKAKGKGRG